MFYQPNPPPTLRAVHQCCLIRICSKTESGLRGAPGVRHDSRVITGRPFLRSFCIIQQPIMDRCPLLSACEFLYSLVGGYIKVIFIIIVEDRTSLYFLFYFKRYRMDSSCRFTIDVLYTLTPTRLHSHLTIPLTNPPASIS
jgi:hypothetical protein